MNKFILDLMKLFSDSFINYCYELILIPKINLYISLYDVETKDQLICKLLEWCSRGCYKSQPYKSEWRNKKYRNELLEKLNKYMHTNFTNDDMELIYQELGNGINHKLTEKFVSSGFDLKLLRSDEYLP